jgi:hypothetical protein
MGGSPCVLRNCDVARNMRKEEQKRIPFGMKTQISDRLLVRPVAYVLHSEVYIKHKWTTFLVEPISIRKYVLS